MVKTLLAWIISAVLLWLMRFIPFMNITFEGTVWVTILIVAVVLGLINAIIVPAVKGVLKIGSPAIIFCISIVVDAAAIWLAHLLIPNFYIEFFFTAIIAAVLLALVNVGVGFEKK